MIIEYEKIGKVKTSVFEHIFLPVIDYQYTRIANSLLMTEGK